MTRPTLTTAPDGAASIGRRRESLDLTQVQLATLAGISPVTLGKFERGYEPVYSRTLPAVLAVLDRLEAGTETGSAARDRRGAAITDGKGRPHHAA